MVTQVPGVRARTALSDTRFADLRWVSETTSTQTDVLAMARDGAPEGAVVVADHQTGGRGRAGRTWEAPPGASILASVLLRPASDRAGLVTATLALAAADAVEEVAGFRPGVKWPNDLVVETEGRTRKLAGVLAEVDWPAGSDMASGWRPLPPAEKVAVIAGIGLNVNWPAEVPAALADVAVACNHVTGREHDRGDLAVALFRHLDRHYGDLVDAGPATITARWRDSLVTLGRAVRVDLGSSDVHGTAVDVDDEGHLVVETVEGERRTFAVGDVHHLR